MAIFFNLGMLIFALCIVWFSWSQVIMPIIMELPTFWWFTKDGRAIMKEFERKRKNNLTKELKNIKRGVK